MPTMPKNKAQENKVQENKLKNTATQNSPTHRKTAFNKTNLIEQLLAHDVLRFGQFELKSGRISPYFFNAGRLSSAQSLAQLASGYASVLAQHSQSVPTLFGAAYKGIPFVAATAYALWRDYGIDADWGYNRKEAKAHGEGGVLVGADLADKSVWVIDDVITAGTAIREVAQLLDTAGAKLAGIVVALDRKERGQNEQSAVQEVAQTFGVQVYSLLDIDDIIAFIKQSGDNERWQQMKIYREQYGV